MALFSSAAAAAVLGSTDNVAICHHDNGVKVYTAISPNVDSIVRVNGHDSHADDIIPSFDYDLGKGAGVQHYPGKNLALLTTLNNGCVTPAAPAAIQVAPVAPSASQSQCSNGVATTPSYTLNGPTGVVYSVNGSTVAGTVPAQPGTSVTVTAAAAPGYVLAPGSTTSFPLTFAAAPSCANNPPPNNPPAAGGAAATPAASPAAPAPDDNLGIGKTGTGTAKPGDELVWNVIVTNTSGTPATGFTVNDTLANGLSFSSAEGPDFNCNAVKQVISCTYSGSLPVGSSATIIVRALLDSSYRQASVSNTAVVDPNRTDSNAGDNTATAVTTVTLPTAPSPSPAAELTGGGGGAAENPPASGAALPFTGAKTAQLVWTSLVLLVSGWLVLILAARRSEQPE